MLRSFIPPSPVYPPHTPMRSLRYAELLLASTLRLYALPFRIEGCKPPDWRRGLTRAGLASEAGGAFGDLFNVVVVAARRSLDVKCPRCPVLSHDEGLLLQMIGLFQHGYPIEAEALLEDWVKPSARRLASQPAERLATAFMEAGFIIPWPHRRDTFSDTNRRAASAAPAMELVC